MVTFYALLGSLRMWLSRIESDVATVLPDRVLYRGLLSHGIPEPQISINLLPGHSYTLMDHVYPDSRTSLLAVSYTEFVGGYTRKIVACQVCRTRELRGLV